MSHVVIGYSSYIGDMLSILPAYTDMDEVSCSIAHDEIFMFRSYVHTYEDGRSILCFEAETYISSVAEMEKYFPQYLNVLLHACERQREIYQQLVADRTSKIVDKSGS